MSLNPNPFRVVLYEGTGARPLENEARFETIQTLLNDGLAVTRAGSERPLPPPDHATLVVLGQFNDSTPAIDSTSSNGAEIHWMPLLPSAENLSQAVRAHATPDQTESEKPWTPWFPVIDYDRCTNCMQCLSFCLFGVYGVDEGQQIQVQNQNQCKTLCPACSRVCPEAAIMFPKYKAGPINGDEVSDSDLQLEKMKVDLSSLLGGDIYSMLRTRSQRANTRFSKERDADKALNERTKCLKALGEIAADIPPEVLKSLPSPEEISRRAAEAAARAAAAQAGKNPA